MDTCFGGVQQWTRGHPDSLPPRGLVLPVRLPVPPSEHWPRSLTDAQERHRRAEWPALRSLPGPGGVLRLLAIRLTCNKAPRGDSAQPVPLPCGEGGSRSEPRGANAKRAASSEQPSALQAQTAAKAPQRL